MSSKTALNTSILALANLVAQELKALSNSVASAARTFAEGKRAINIGGRLVLGGSAEGETVAGIDVEEVAAGGLIDEFVAEGAEGGPEDGVVVVVDGGGETEGVASEAELTLVSCLGAGGNVGGCGGLAGGR